MEVFRRIAVVAAAVGLAVAFVALGFLACIAPPTTHLLSSMHALDAVSPFDRTQLVKVADATREYSFGAHSDLEMYRAIYDIDVEYRQSIEKAGGTLPTDFPHVENLTRDASPSEFERVFAAASEMYCYSPDTMSHLDDCHAIVQTAFPFVVGLALLGIACLVLCGVLGKKRTVSTALIVAGAGVLVAFVLLGAWALFDFNGLFTTFHQLFFAQGNWTFPYDSLLICALPTEFWMGMGIVWLAVSIIAAVASLVVGFKLKR